MTHPKSPSVTIIQHPLVQHNLAIIRHKTAHGDTFKCAFNRLATLLLVEATKHIQLVQSTVETPLMTTQTQVIDVDYKIIFAPILRAGLGLSDIALNLVPSAIIYHIGMYRDENTFNPVWYYDKSPVQFDCPEKTKVFILDPMLATGGSALAAIDLFVGKGVSPDNIIFVSVLSAPEGIAKIVEKYKMVQIITGAIDDRLNAHAYIMPGLGDAGDRLFNTTK